MQIKGEFMLFNLSEFKDWLFKQSFTREINLIQMHHTWSPNYSNFNGNNHFALVESMKEYHVKTAGFSTIAQNITIYPDGMIMVCRPFNKAPAGIRGANANGLCIENIGNFDIGKDTMTAEHKEAIIFVTAVLCMKLKLTPSIDSITYHHWWDLNTGIRVLDNTSGHVTKSCPGTNFFSGNTTTAAKTNFYPLVINKINELTNPQPIVKTGYTTMRMYDSDIHIYTTNTDEDVDVTLGQQGKLEKLSTITEADKVITAKINGGFFNLDGSSEHLGTFVDEGKYYNSSNPVFIDFVYYNDGHTEVKFLKDTNEIAYAQGHAKWAIGTSWSLVVDGKINIINAEKIDHSKQKHPRTLLGQKKDGSFVFVVVQGRTANNAGVNAQQSADIMFKLGCWNAVNLDGGGSSEMIVQNQIKNKPSDGVERKVGSAIIAYKKNVNSVNKESEVVSMVLRKGDNGEAVSNLQTNLNKLGYTLVVDGDFGGKTEAAVIDFQGKHNLGADGIVGEKTKAAIETALKALLPFADWENVSDWAKPAVKKVKELGIMVGDANGNFNPKETLTREQYALTIYNVLKLLGKVE